MFTMKEGNGMAEEKGWDLSGLDRFQKGSQKIGIFELADLFGVTTMALRKYEDKKLLQPFRDENGYRKYSSWDLTKIIRLRQLRQEGFSLESIAEELSQNDAGRRFQKLEEMKGVLAQEILYRQRLIAWLDTREEELRQFEARGEECVVEHQSRRYCCVYMVGDTLADKKGREWEHLKEWIQALPFARVYHVAGGDTPVGEALSCLSLREDELKKYGLEYLTPDFVLPEGPCAVSNLTAEAYSDHNNSAQVVFQARRRAEELKLSLSRRFYAIQMVWYTQQNGVFRSYNKAMFPLAEEK